MEQESILQHEILPSTSIVPHQSLRLGQLVEQYTFALLQENKEVQLLATNLQIIENKLTLGELDAIIRHRQQLIHLEISYKFYLYDDSVGDSELAHWIGPNRRDSLVKKLTKLKEKQFPLLHHPVTQETLFQLGIDKQTIIQKVFFPAQLFIPLNCLSNKFSLINRDCIVGFYLRKEQLVDFTRHQFYIPKKLDWLVHPHEEVEWLSHSDFLKIVENDFLLKQRSPLCWIKNELQELHKIFLVWW